MAIRELAFEYSTRGAKAAQRADENVRSSIKDTARVADRRSGAVDRWMTRNKRSIQAVGAAMGAVVGGMLASAPQIRAELSGIRSAFTLFSTTVMGDVLPAGGSLTQLAFRIVNGFRDLPEPIRTAISLFTVIAGVIGTVIAVAAPLIKALGVVVGAVGAVVGAIGAVPLVLGLATAALVAWAAAVIFNVGGARDKALKFLSDLRDGIVDRLSSARDFVVEWGSDVHDGIVDRLSNARDWIGSTWTKITDPLVDPVSDAWEDMKDWLGDVKDGVIDRLSDAREWLSDTWSDAKDLLTSPITDAWDSLKSTLGDISDLVTDTFASGWNAVVGGRTLTLPEATISVPDWVPEIGGRSYDVGGQSLTIPELDTGGLIQRDGLAMLHSGERVVPEAQVTDRGEINAASGRTVIIEEINVDVQGTGNSRRDGENVAQKAAEEFERTLGSRGV